MSIITMNADGTSINTKGNVPNGIKVRILSEAVITSKAKLTIVRNAIEISKRR